MLLLLLLLLFPVLTLAALFSLTLTSSAQLFLALELVLGDVAHVVFRFQSGFFFEMVQELHLRLVRREESLLIPRFLFSHQLFFFFFFLLYEGVFDMAPSNSAIGVFIRHPDAFASGNSQDLGGSLSRRKRFHDRLLLLKLAFLPATFLRRRLGFRLDGALDHIYAAVV